MPMYQVWTGNDIFAMVFGEDTAGAAIGISNESNPDPFSDTPIFTYCIIDNVTIEGSHARARRPSTGRVHKKLVPSDYEYSCTVSNLYLKKSELDQNNVFERSSFLSIYFIFLSYVKNPSTQKEWHRLKRCMASSFSVSSEENGLCKCNANFLAEEYITG